MHPMLTKTNLKHFSQGSKKAADIQAERQCRKRSRIKALLKRGIAEPIHTDRQRRSGIYGSVIKLNHPSVSRQKEAKIA